MHSPDSFMKISRFHDKSPYARMPVHPAIRTFLHTDIGILDHAADLDPAGKNLIPDPPGLRKKKLLIGSS
jgi:hypothetical protein